MPTTRKCLVTHTQADFSTGLVRWSIRRTFGGLPTDFPNERTRAHMTGLSGRIGPTVFPTDFTEDFRTCPHTFILNVMKYDGTRKGSQSRRFYRQD
ncbi:hypothetical protein AB205_0216450 [Aquarana catesbeiana]|uniref:Uncharacterized protein n=1 Tax=Aquarana catesbeiana TaxID=8400 RepID=A0A2G9SBV6_AQUCT|nr:hypothetical protein AB205_0216450 [Aquarana catesbeiana]